ncbi:unnamed protein product [Meloidogyne enterolobii]|uniref:Uncharacterized protein n=1 Tax=Meloidogyne enterolobii TaxID=390850 RepID=A0ACB0Z767_MELEN
MFVRCHLPMELDPGPGTRKSPTLCSLVLVLFVIATFLVCEVHGQMKEEIVGLGNHKRNGSQVELNPYTVKVTEKDFNLTEYKGRFQDACDVKIEKDYIELQYNEDGKGCIVDLLSKNKTNKDKIKLTAIVRNKRGGIKKCLDAGKEVEDSYNNNMPFVYSVSNEVIEKLNKGLNDDSMGACKNVCMSCMTRTSLEVSWSKYKEEDVNVIYAHTHLSIIDEAERGLTHEKSRKDTFDLEITATNKFTMNFEKHEVFALKDTVCVAETVQAVKPEAWSITNKELHELHGQHLLVFSLLSRNATLVFEGKKVTSKKQSMPHCELFVQFKRSDYELLYVKPLPAKTTTTAKTTTKSCPTIPEAATCTPCPPTSAPCPEKCPPCPAASTLFSNNKLMTTTAATNIPSSADPAKNKCPEESCGWLYIVIAVIVVCLIIIGVLAWFWKKRDSEKKENLKSEEDLYALYKAEEKVIGPHNMKQFDVWKAHRKQNELEELPIERLVAIMWKRTERKTRKDKIQAIVDECSRQINKELKENEYPQEMRKKGLRETFERWKKRNNIDTAFTVIEGTTTAVESEQPKAVEGVIVEKVDKVKADENVEEAKADENVEEAKADENVEEVKADGNVEEVKADENIEDGVSVPLSEGGV